MIFLNLINLNLGPSNIFAHHYYNDMYSVCMGCVVHGIGVCLAHQYFSLQCQEEDTMHKYLK